MSEARSASDQSPLSLDVFPEKYVVTQLIEHDALVVAAFGFDPATGAEVFLKAKSREDTSTNIAALLRNEANILASVEHPQIAKLVEADADAEVPYLVASRMPNDLGAIPEWFRRNSDPRQAASILISALQPLEYIHSEGITHGEVKTADLALAWQEPIGLLDFERASRKSPTSPTSNYPRRKPRGNVHYLAPEQSHDGLAPTPQSDTYSANVVFYELLFGRRPFADSMDWEIVWQHVFDKPNYHVPDGRTVPDEFIEILDKGMAKKPANRFKNAGEMGDALKRAVTLL